MLIKAGRILLPFYFDHSLGTKIIVNNQSSPLNPETQARVATNHVHYPKKSCHRDISDKPISPQCKHMQMFADFAVNAPQLTTHLSVGYPRRVAHPPGTKFIVCAITTGQLSSPDPFFEARTDPKETPHNGINTPNHRSQRPAHTFYHNIRLGAHHHDQNKNKDQNNNHNEETCNSLKAKS